MSSRRTVVGGLLLAAGCAFAANVAAAESEAGPHASKDKVSKDKAWYQDHPNDIQSCALCTLFAAPDGCKAVEGKVNPEGWCALFALAD